jgi:allantoin racemase
MTRLLLINPNTNAATTNMMRAIAQAAAPGGTLIDAMSAPYGVPLITNDEALAQSAKAVQALAGTIASTPPDGVIISAFGDPGLAALRLRLSCPVTGIAEAGMAEAGSGRRPFAVVTTTPDLVDSITALAHAYGHGATFRGVALTEGDVHAVMADHETLVEALAKACAYAIETLGAQALVIGGGPLGQAAQSLSMRFPVPVIAPIPAAVRLAHKRVLRRS